MRNLLKAFKTELRLTERQKDKVRRSLGICRFLANQYIARNIWLYRLYQRGVLDEKQRRFVTANDFDKYVNHVLKKKLLWIASAAPRRARRSSSMQSRRSDASSRDKRTFHSSSGRTSRM